MRCRSRRRRFSEINVVPFIDIVLVLLVIVLATATFVVKSQLPVTLPKSGSQAPLPPKSLTLTIDKEGHYYLEKRRAELTEIAHALARLDPAKDQITLNADRQSRFQPFVTLIDLLKKRGFEKISIVTSP